MKWYWYAARFISMAWVGFFLILTVNAQDAGKLSTPQSMYESKALIRIYQDSDVLVIAWFPREASVEAAFISNEMDIMRSQKNFQLVIEKLGLQKEWGRRLLKGVEMSPDQAQSMLRDRIRISSHQRNANAVEICAKSDIPKEAADIANAIVDAYIDPKREDLKNKQARHLQTLDEEIAKEAVVMEGAKDKLEKMRQRKTSDLSGFQEAVKELDRQQIIFYQMTIRRKQQNGDWTKYHDPVEIVARAEPSDKPIPQHEDNGGILSWLRHLVGMK